MSLAPSSRLGPYEIISAIGAGGMGEVFRARDARLKRDAAIKILPDLFVADADRVAQGPVPLGDEKSGLKPGTPVAFLKAPYSELSAMFSPDGRWVAYLSNEGGRNDVFVQPYPGPGGKYQTSAATADDPTWSRAASEFFFLNTADFRLMVMPYRIEGNTFNPGKPVVLNDTRIAIRPRVPSRDLDLQPDGKRFAVAGTEDQAAQKLDKVVFVFNFFDELRRIAPHTRLLKSR